MRVAREELAKSMCSSIRVRAWLNFELPVGLKLFFHNFNIVMNNAPKLRSFLRLRRRSFVQQCVCVYCEQKLATPHTRDRLLQLKKKSMEKDVLDDELTFKIIQKIN